MNISIHPLTNPKELATSDCAEGIHLPPEDEWNRLQPDALFAAELAGKIQAVCSVWKNSLPIHKGNQPAAIGHFHATDPQAGSAALEAACTHLRVKGATLVLGPVNANTWNPYRLVTESNGRPPFLLEPANPDFYVDAWKASGFTTFAEYHSIIMPPQTEPDPRLSRVKERLHSLGVRIRNIQMDDFEAELRHLYHVSCISFRNNLLFTPISESGFKESYLPFRDKIRPELVWLAEKGGNCVGYLFCIPDYLQTTSGVPVDTVIAKTLAILPHRQYAGLGLLLMQRFHSFAASAGYRHVIHALMARTSQIKHFGKDRSERLRTYTLFSKPL